MDLPLGGDDALAQPTRARIFAWLADHVAPASTEAIAAALGLHPNGVRRHLDRLRDAGLVERGRSRGGRGRPGDLWAVAAEADPGGRRPTSYADLSRWLARAIPPGRNRLREVERVGREIGQELAPEDSVADPVETFRQALASLGFRPELEPSGEDGFVCRLENCPYRDSVRENQPVVCALHRGITTGLLARLLPEARLTRFEPDDPDRAGCVVGITAPLDEVAA
ncbi:MAG: helix-turn-helix domain-containing protein [Solirubrobacterales bacterium]